MIFKLQRSIVSTRPEPQVLIYNQDRSFIYKGSLTDYLRDIFQSRLKVFVDVRDKLDDKTFCGHFSYRLVPEQSW